MPFFTGKYDGISMSKNGKKTIVISSFHTLISRNILCSGMLELLREKANIVIFCPERKKDFFDREFKGEGVDIEGIADAPLSRSEQYMRTMGATLLPTSTIFLKKRTTYWRDKKLLNYAASFFLLHTIARFHQTPRLFRRLFLFFYNKNVFENAFAKYNPDIVFSTDVLDWLDVRMLAEAKRSGIKTAGMVRSWDNVTNKSLLPVSPGHFIVNNECIRDELAEFNAVPFKDITVVGMPQFDYYIGYQPTGRKKFFKKLGFDANRRMIMFAPMGKKFIDTDRYMLQLLHDAVLSGEINGAPQILVRFPPGDDFVRDGLAISDSVPVFFDRPGMAYQSAKKKDNEMGKEDMIHLADSLFYSDVLINPGSTLCVDMAAFGRPVICNRFDGGEAHYFRSVESFPEFHHCRYLFKSKGIRSVFSKDELIGWINRYMANSSLDLEERKKLTREHAYIHDGKAHERLASCVLQLLENEQKTIFIPIFQGAEAKNILRTKIYDTLLSDPDVRIVFFVANSSKAEYYQKEFSHPRVIYEVFDRYRPPFGNGIFEFLKFRLMNNPTIDLRRRRARDMGGTAFGYIGSYVLTRVFGRPRFRKLVRFLDRHFIRDNNFTPFFEKYGPSLVFAAHLFGEIETALLREAKRRGVLSVGLVNSWDKLTGRAMFRLLPDKILVFNEILKREAIDYADMDAQDIHIVGIPPFDYYVTDMPSARSDFAERIGIHPDKKIIVYAPLGRSNSKSDWDILDMLQSFITDGKIKRDSALLVRYPPNDFADEEEIKKRPRIYFDIPGVRFTKKRGFGLDWDMTKNDLQHLLDTLHHADVFVSYASTLVLDVVVFDKPIININFELKNDLPLSHTPTSFYATEHYQKALRTGAIRMAASPNELIECINTYLSRPSEDSKGRARLRHEQCWKLDGKAGERTATFLLELLSH
ncbi:MAG: CDP-glycerol glycerophosphotransferase family protein [Candidatus Niyogibacteria bacterium]|nr:CDP-glycerol glycerophosphotransferase family protein [Candidatus Niyogibacteria bacterium]